MKTLLVIIVVLALGAGAAWHWAGGAEGPAIGIEKPLGIIGPIGELAVVFDAPAGQLSRVDVQIEQNGVRLPVFATTDAQDAQLAREGEHRRRLERNIGKRDLPQLEAGRARIHVLAERPVLFGLRHVQSSLVHDVEVRLTRPTIEVVSRFHYVNQGGSELVVYRITPQDAASGVRVGEYEYPGFAAAGAGVVGADAGLRVAFFALLWNQDPKTNIDLYARDAVGNEGRAEFDYRVIPKKFRRSRIELDERFLAKVVPAILRESPELKVANPSDLLASFLVINRELRRQNNARIEQLARSTESRMLWRGPFEQLANTAVEGGFADQRAYFYQGPEVDRQVHLGFDLASTMAAAVVAANSGTVVLAGPLGIYGNCVVVDHGMGLQTLYAHLSAIEVVAGQPVEKGGRLGRSGSTGLAAGDHLHFTTLLAGRPVTPVDWWSAKWVQDRIVRKLREADVALSPASGL